MVINDGSIDGSGRVLDKLRKENPELRVVHQLNTGSTRACRRGYELARGKYVLVVSANGRCEPSDFAPLWEQRHQYDLVIGRRIHRLDSLKSQAFSVFLRTLATKLFGVSLDEPALPFRLFLRSPTVDLIHLVPMDWTSFHFSMTILSSLQFPDRVTEVRIPYRHRLERKAPSRRVGMMALAWAYLVEAVSLKLRIIKSKNDLTSLRTLSHSL